MSESSLPIVAAEAATTPAEALEAKFNSVPTSCDRCGLCCQGIGSPVLIYATNRRWGDAHPFRPVDLPAELIAEIDDHFRGLTRGQEPQAECLWYDRTTQRCRHYEFRPQVCRDYELAGPACLQRRALITLESVCDLGNETPLHQPSDIRSSP